MRIPKSVTVALVAWLAVRAIAADDPPRPRPTKYGETVEKRLVQIDVGVEGDRDAIRAITANDFALRVGGHEIQGLIVDPICADEPEAPVEPDDQPSETPPTLAAPKTARPQATFIFFFDQPHLTQPGRALSLETAHDLINRLVVEGSRASIVSNAKRLQTIVPMTGDRKQLLAGLDRLRSDTAQWDSYASTEQARAAVVGEAYSECVIRFHDEYKCQLPPYCPSLTSKAFATEEWQEARRSTERLGFTVGTLAEAPAPKALVYFGDSLRQQAGLHYLHVAPCLPSGELQSAETTPSAAAAFDAVINEALASGVHFFTIQAEGLVAVGDGAATPLGWNAGMATATGRGWNAERQHAAQDALVGLAAETGGEAFLGGASHDFIAGRIAARTSCMLLLSFPPGELPRDKPLAVTLEFHVPGVKLQTQGRVVVPSPASIEQARLLAAFTDPASADDGSLRVFLIPRGGDGRTWNAAVQLRLRPSGIPDTSAELGASIVRQDKVSDHFASSIAAKSGNRAIVLEKSLKIAPGAFSVVAVARDVNRTDVASSRLDANWPGPARGSAAIAPVAVLQNGSAAFSKDGEALSSGSLARAEGEILDSSVSVVLASVVCRGDKIRAPIIVERSLEDGSTNDFVPMTIDATGAPCVQTVDVVRVGRLKPGVVEYRVVARIGDEIVAQARRPLRVGVPGEPQ